VPPIHKAKVTMRIFFHLAELSLVLSTVAVTAVAANGPQRIRGGKVNQEEAAYWDRLLEDMAGSMAPIAPTRSPMMVTKAPAPPTRVPRFTSAPASAPTKAPVVPPTPAPTEITLSPTTSPTATPTEITLSPTSTISSTPTEVSSSPSDVPSSSPSTNPSSTPSVEISSSPTIDCDLHIEIGCLAPFFGADCNEIEQLMTQCLDPPSSMVLRYSGGDCGSSFNIQPNAVFTCMDDEAPSGNSSYIIATGFAENEEVVYFEGFVGKGDDFTIEAEFLIANITNILILDPADLTDPVEIVQAGVLLQAVTFATSCDEFLFLSDRFGAIQLIEFENERQGRVSSFQDITLTFTVELPEDGSVGPTELMGLSVSSNIEIGDGEVTDLTDLVAGMNLTAESRIVVQETFVIDLSQRNGYTTTATVMGNICQGSDQYEFTAGNRLPPFFPTMTPTVSPTLSPVPTPDPDTAVCEVEASISCSVADGRRCELRNPEGRTCIGTAPTMLQFMYQPNATCSTNTTASNFQCEDATNGTALPDAVYVVMSDGGTADTWFFAATSKGQIVDIPVGGADSMSIQIFTDDAESPGTLLQSSQMDILCNEGSGLTLLSYFGSLQLVGYSNAELGVEQVFASIEIEYKAENVGVLSMELVEAFATSPFTGFQDFLSSDGEQTLSRGESSTYTERFTLNLQATAGLEFQFSFLAQGLGTTSREPCESTDVLTLSIVA